MENLTKIRNELKAPKELKNNFGGYRYRSAEQILEAVKPLLAKYGSTINIKEDILCIGDRYYIKSTATYVEGEEQEEATGYAREQETKKGMDQAQITGACSSYSKKYALQNLLLIDDSSLDPEDPKNYEKEPFDSKDGVREPSRPKETRTNLQILKSELFNLGAKNEKEAIKIINKKLDGYEITNFPKKEEEAEEILSQIK